MKLIQLVGRISTFGGPDDKGMRDDEPLSLYEFHKDANLRPDLFLPQTLENEKLGTCKRLRVEQHYIAIRFDKKERPVHHWRCLAFQITNPKTMKFTRACLVDWGPNEKTGRVGDFSPGLAEYLGLKTDDVALIAEVH